MASPLDAFFPSTEAIFAMGAPGAMMARFILGGIILLGAIWTDLMQRRVPNVLWLWTAGIGLVVIVYDLVVGSPDWRWLAAIPFVVGFAYLLWRVRLLFGGADAKCMMAIAILTPYPAAIVSDGVAWPHLPALLPASVSMLMNAVTFTLLVPIIYFLINIFRGDLHPFAMFLGTKARLDRVFTDPVWVMDWVQTAADRAAAAGEDALSAATGPSLDELDEEPDLDEAGLPIVDRESLAGATVRLHYMPTRAGDYVLNLARLRAMGVQDVWVTPKLPFMIPLFLGFVAAFTLGDLVVAFTLWTAGLL